MTDFCFKEENFENVEKCFKEFIDRENKEDLDYYFNSYSYVDIHQEMLQDQVRTNAYKKAILGQPNLFKGKVVMDIGAGSGILSMFAARAGASKVYAIEKADIFKVAQKIIKENKLDGIIEVINSSVETLTLPEQSVDIIISEWMGYFLLFEGMFDSVIFAAKKFLKKNGQLFPNEATMSMAAVDYRKQDYGYYKNLIKPCSNKISQSNNSILYHLSQLNYLTADVREMNTKSIISESASLKYLNLEKVEVKDLDWKSSFEIKATKNSLLSGFVFWFDTSFTHGNQKIVLDTSPNSPQTHWQQGYMQLRNQYKIKKGDSIKGTLVFIKCPFNKRNINLKLTYKLPTLPLKTQYFIFQ